VLRKLVTLAILAAIAYYGYTVGLPWWHKQQATREAEETADVESEQSLRCVSMATDANRTLVDQVRQFDRPPSDPGLWTAALIHIGGELSGADTACACPTDACTKASLALREMRELVDQVDGVARGYATGISNPASRQERIVQLLEEARSLARD
jgi:hypothetical protein